jgi:acyl-CoA reductase-like NAD-dependent aldehyde dehydrogenase
VAVFGRRRRRGSGRNHNRDQDYGRGEAMAYQTINPANGKVFKTYEDISDAALNEVMDVAQACYENDWRRRSVAQRAGIVHAAATRKAITSPAW